MRRAARSCRAGGGRRGGRRGAGPAGEQIPTKDEDPRTRAEDGHRSDDPEHFLPAAALSRAVGVIRYRAPVGPPLRVGEASARGDLTDVWLPTPCRRRDPTGRRHLRGVDPGHILGGRARLRRRRPGRNSSPCRTLPRGSRGRRHSGYGGGCRREIHVELGNRHRAPRIAHRGEAGRGRQRQWRRRQVRGDRCRNHGTRRAKRLRLGGRGRHFA
jgi:hypothetical protein